MPPTVLAAFALMLAQDPGVLASPEVEVYRAATYVASVFPKSIRKVDSTETEVLVRQRYVVPFLKRSRTDSLTVGSAIISYTVANVRVNCTTHRSHVHSITYYTPEGAVRSSYLFSSRTRQEPVLSGTARAATWDYVCGARPPS